MPNSQSNRDLKFTTLDEVVADVGMLSESGYSRLGNWSLGQCCNHLAQAMDMSIDGFPATVPPPFSVVGNMFFFKLPALAQVIGRVRFPTFPNARQTEPVDDQVGQDRLQKAIERISATSAEFKRNPFLGRLTQEQWLYFHAFHARRHLGFLIPNDSAES